MQWVIILQFSIYFCSYAVDLWFIDRLRIGKYFLLKHIDITDTSEQCSKIHPKMYPYIFCFVCVCVCAFI